MQTEIIIAIVGASVLVGMWGISSKLVELNRQLDRSNKLLRHLCWRAGKEEWDNFPWNDPEF